MPDSSQSGCWQQALMSLPPRCAPTLSNSPPTSMPWPPARGQTSGRRSVRSSQRETERSGAAVREAAMSSSKIQQSPSDTAMTDPVRYPVSASPQVRTKRGFVLVLMTLLVPGSAQLVAGDRKLGRAALRVTLCAWAVLVLAVLLLLVSRPLLINIITNPFASLA